MATTNYGYSDDLIEFDGTIRGEHNHLSEEEVWFTFSGDGVPEVKISWRYTNYGAWRFSTEESREYLSSLGFEFKPLPEEWDYSMEDEMGYTDYVTIPSAYTTARTSDGHTVS